MTSNIWYIFAFLLIAFELLGIFHLAALFAGLSALATGLFVELELIGKTSYQLQIILFLLLSVSSIGFSWMAIQPATVGDTFKDLVGSTALLVKAPIRGGAPGLIRWSGTDLVARYAEECAGDLEPGTEIIIVHIKGNIAYIKGDS